MTSKVIAASPKVPSQRTYTHLLWLILCKMETMYKLFTSSLLSNLEHFINDPEMSQWDPLIKMAVVHHQF